MGGGGWRGDDVAELLRVPRGGIWAVWVSSLVADGRGGWGVKVWCGWMARATTHRCSGAGTRRARSRGERLKGVFKDRSARRLPSIAPPRGLERAGTHSPCPRAPPVVRGAARVRRSSTTRTTRRAIGAPASSRRSRGSALCSSGILEGPARDFSPENAEREVHFLLDKRRDVVGAPAAVAVAALHVVGHQARPLSIPQRMHFR